MLYQNVAPWDFGIVRRNTKYKFMFRQEQGGMSRVPLILAGEVSKNGMQEYMAVDS
jgi:hypothetical protein